MWAASCAFVGLVFIALCQRSSADATLSVEDPYTEGSIAAAQDTVAENIDWGKLLLNAPAGINPKLVELLRISVKEKDHETRIIHVYSSEFDHRSVFLVRKTLSACNLFYIAAADKFQGVLGSEDSFDATVAHFEFAANQCADTGDPTISTRIRYRFGKALKDACVNGKYTYGCGQALGVLKSLFEDACREVGKDKCLSDKTEFAAVVDAKTDNPIMVKTGVTVSQVADAVREILQLAVTAAVTQCRDGNLTSDQTNWVMQTVNGDPFADEHLRGEASGSIAYVANTGCKNAP